MADIPSTAIMEGKFVWSCHGQTCMNVLHWYPDGIVAGVDPIELMDSFLSVISDNNVGDIMPLIAELQSSQVSWQKVTAQLIHPYRYIVREAVVAQIGADVNPCTAQNVQASIEKTGIAGTRSNIGAIHIGGLPQTNYSLGLVTAGTLTKLQTLADKLEQDVVEPLGPSTWHPGILNKEIIPNTDPPKYRIKSITPLFEYRVKNTLRVMRRRTIGVGD